MSSLPPSWPRSASATAGLLPWMIPLPSYAPTVALQTVVAEVSQPPWPSHIIVVDDQRHPQGCLSLGLLWACQQGQVGDAPAVSVQDCLPWLEPVVILVAQTAPAELCHLVPPPSPPCWVVVDGEGQYLGVVNVTELVAQGQLSSDLDAVDLNPPPRLATASVQEQQWVMAISHALKTPLTSLLGLSTLLLDYRVGSLNDRQSRYAGLMRRAIRKLIRLVNQLVDWMRLEAGQLELDATTLDLKALSETLLPTFLTSWLPDAAAAPPWMATFRCHLPPHLPPLRADRLRLQQSLYGILGYLLHRGATPQTLTLEPWGAWMGLTLRATPSPEADTPPLPPWTVTLGAEVDGMETLGLALARRLCQQQGGDLVGFCSPWDGYQITVLLPLAQAGPETLVLLVSADGASLGQTQAQLMDGNIRLLLATHWEEAVDLVQRLAPAWVLLDADSLGEIPADPLVALTQIAPPTSRVVDSLDALTVALALEPNLDQRHSLERDPAGTPDQNPAMAPTEGTTGTTGITGTTGTTMGTTGITGTMGTTTPPEPLTLLVLAYRGQLAPAKTRAPLATPWQTALQRQRCQLVQADDLPQARTLCRVWQPQAIVLVEGQGFTPEDWDWVNRCPELMQRPWIALTSLATAYPPRLALVNGADILATPPTEGVVSLIQLVRATQG